MNFDFVMIKCIQTAIEKVTEAQNYWDSKCWLGEYVHGVFVERYNILKATNGRKGLLSAYIYFDASKFPSHDGFKGKARKNLF